VVADIHSNLEAFESVIAEAEQRRPVDAVWAMGDIVGYGPDPAACIALLRRYNHLAVAGNHDRAVTGRMDTIDFNAYAATAARWTAGVLGEAERAYLDGLPETALEEDFTLVHGSLRDPLWEYVLSGDAASHHLDLQTTPYSFIGHSHLQLVFVEPGEGRARGTLMGNGDTLKLGGERCVANPGGLGQPRDGDPRSAYAILDTDERRLSFHRVEYDIARTQKKMLAAGLPEYLIERLSRGR
jgi:diadenosine tetraphosphatase ApaH/serine/threonine PP2A family protein phosphatase